MYKGCTHSQLPAYTTIQAASKVSVSIRRRTGSSSLQHDGHSGPISCDSIIDQVKEAVGDVIFKMITDNFYVDGFAP